MHDLVKVWFLGVRWGLTVCLDGGEIASGRRPQLLDTVNGFPDGPLLLGIDNSRGDASLSDIARVIGASRQQRPTAYYVVTPGRRVARDVRKIFGKYCLGTTRIIGVDPDYYFSMTTLEGPGRRSRERFVFGLKTTPRARQRFKAMVLKAVIGAGLPSLLYERFVVTATSGTLLAEGGKNPEITDD